MSVSGSRSLRIGFGWGTCALASVGVALLTLPFRCDAWHAGVPAISLLLVLAGLGVFLVVRGLMSTGWPLWLRVSVFVPLGLVSVLWGMYCGLALVLSPICRGLGDFQF